MEINEVYDTPRISHCHIELPVSWAYVDVNGKVTVVSSTQIPHIVRRCTAQALGIPIGKSVLSSHISAAASETSRMCFMNR